MTVVRRGGPASVLLAGLVLLAVVAPPAGAARQPSQTASPTTMVLRDRTAWVGEGTDFVLTVQVDGAPAGATMRLTVHDRVRSRSEFARSLEGEGLRSVRHRLPEVALADIDTEGNGLVSVAVPLVARDGRTAVSLPQPGVYPVVLEVLADGQQVAVLRTYLVRLPPFDPESEAVPLDVVVALPIHAAPVHLTPGPPSRPDLPLAAITGALSGHPTVALTAVPTPETLDAAAVTDSATTAALVATLADRQVLTGPWVDLDEAAWAVADREELVGQLDRGRRTLVQVLDVEPDGVRLVPAGSTTATVTTMAGTGATGLVLAGDDLAALDSDDFPFTLTRPFAVDVDGAAGGATLPALASDAGLVAHAATAAEDPVLAASNLLADLAVLSSDQPALRRAATVVLPAPAARSGEFLDTLLGGLEPPSAPTLATAEPIPAAAPIVTSRTAAAAFAEVEAAGAEGEPDPAEPLVRTLPGEPAPPDVGPTARLLQGARADLASFGATFGVDTTLFDDLDRLVATNAAAELTSTDRAASMQSFDNAIDGQLAGLHGPDSQRVRLTAREGRIQLLLFNDTGQPANVTLVLRGDRLVLPDAPDGRMPVTLVEAQTRVDVRVEARSSGDAPLDIVLTTPEEGIELDRARVTVRATAVSGVGALLLAASAAFLVIWWTRTIVRERRHADGRHPAHARGSHPDGGET